MAAQAVTNRGAGGGAVWQFLQRRWPGNPSSDLYVGVLLLLVAYHQAKTVPPLKASRLACISFGLRVAVSASFRGCSTVPTAAAPYSSFCVKSKPIPYCWVL